MYSINLYQLMEKSLINEFKNSNSTLFHSTVLGTNSSLALRPKEQDIYKSRIAHLPADHRQDLSRKLDFLVVFQTIQIERLSQQISFLRGRVRQQEGRTLNTNSYQIQIRQLMEKCNKLQNEKYSYREQLSQTKDASQNIFNQLSILKSRYADVDFCIAEKYKLEKARNEELCLQIQKWKSRYNSLQKIKGQQHDGYRRLLQTQKQSMMNRESKDLLIKFQLEKEELLGRLRDRKEQLDQRDLQIKKLHNHYEQLQVRSRQDNAKMQNYQQKVALLSQQTFRLNQLVRIKQEQIKNFKLMQNDFSIRMSRFTNLDQTTNQLSQKVRYLQDENDELREENKRISDSLSHLKRKVSEIERLEFQNQEAKSDIQSKLKALQRKDRKIIALEEELKQMQILEDQISQIKSENQNMKYQLIDLQERLDIKIEQLANIKQQQINLLRWRDDFNEKIQTKIHQYQLAYQSLQRQYSDFRVNSQKSIEKSTNYELQIKQFAIQLKEKEYRINTLQNQLKQYDMKSKTKEAQTKQLLKELQQHLFLQRRNFQQKLKQAETRNRENESRSRQSQAKARQIQIKFKDYQASNNSYQLKARNLQAQCNDLENWGRSLQSKNNHLQLHIQDLQIHINEMQQQNMEFRNIIEQQRQFYQNAQEKYYAIGQDLKSLKIRLENIQKILISLKTNIGLKLKSAEDFDYKLHIIEQKYEDLYQWFSSVTGNFQKSRDSERIKDSPTKLPYHNFFGSYSNQSSRFSPSLKDQSSYQTTSLQRAKSMERTRQNINLGNRNQQLSMDILIKHVLLCIQIESLRKRVGDKNAKVQSMRNSIVVKGYPQPNGFFTNRQPSAGKRNIYY